MPCLLLLYPQVSALLLLVILRPLSDLSIRAATKFIPYCYSQTLCPALISSLLVLPSHHTTAFNPHCFPSSHFGRLPCPTTLPHQRACRSSKTGRPTFLTSCTSWTRCGGWPTLPGEMLSWRDKGDNGAVDLLLVGRLGKANLDCAQSDYNDPSY
jgi:hypothetical protein